MTYQDWLQLLGPVVASASLNPLGKQITDSANNKISAKKMLKVKLQEPFVETDFFGYLLKPLESEISIDDELLKVFFQPDSHKDEIVLYITQTNNTEFVIPYCYGLEVVLYEPFDPYTHQYQPRGIGNAIEPVVLIAKIDKNNVNQQPAIAYRDRDGDLHTREPKDSRLIVEPNYYSFDSIVCEIGTPGYYELKVKTKLLNQSETEYCHTIRFVYIDATASEMADYIDHENEFNIVDRLANDTF